MLDERVIWIWCQKYAESACDVDFWVFTQNTLRHQYQTPHIKVHITLCQHVLHCQFLSIVIREFDITILEPIQYWSLISVI